MAYLFIGLILFFLAALIVIAKVYEDEEMEEE